jgi:hypothetical protein
MWITPKPVTSGQSSHRDSIEKAGQRLSVECMTAEPDTFLDGSSIVAPPDFGGIRFKTDTCGGTVPKISSVNGNYFTCECKADRQDRLTCRSAALWWPNQQNERGRVSDHPASVVSETRSFDQFVPCRFTSQNSVSPEESSTPSLSVTAKALPEASKAKPSSLSTT